MDETEREPQERTQKREYEICGEKYEVIRHFAGGEDLRELFMELARHGAKRELGLEP